MIRYLASIFIGILCYSLVFWPDNVNKGKYIFNLVIVSWHWITKFKLGSGLDLAAYARITLSFENENGNLPSSD
jgi:hypothetical protein